MKPTRFVFLAALLLAASARSQEVLEYKGVAFGASLDSFTSLHPEFSCIASKRVDGGMECMGGRALCRAQSRQCYPSDFEASKYAEEWVNIVNAVFVDGKFERLEIFFDPDSFDGISEALKTKYGKPKQTTRRPYETVGGAKSMNTSLFWERADGQILIDRYGETLSEGRLIMASQKWVTTSVGRDAAKSKSRVKSM